MRVATLELDVRTGDVEGNLRAAREALGRAAEGGAQLASLPEMWPTSFVASAGGDTFEASGEAVGALADLAAELGVVTVGSAFAAGDEGELPTNRAHVLAGGRVVAHYDKVHLFSPTAEHLAFSAGETPPPVFEHPGLGARIAPIICYDLRFPAVARAAFRAGAEILVTVAQWPDARAPHWRALVRGRAAELEGFVVACNRLGVDEIGRRKLRLSFSGDSAVVRPSGEPSEAIAQEEIEAVGRRASRVTLYDIDVDEARSLRRQVPVANDERVDLIRRWIGSE
ncbi:MAG: nitrilase-related carbon-nitrogen hydrolase [Planctomycetota bacterium]